MTRSLENILLTGAVNSEESQRIRDAGYVWKPCRWCSAMTYTKGGLCRPCDDAMRADDEDEDQ